jgi:hypothetical protein
MAIIYKIHYVNVPVEGDEAADGMVKAYIGSSLSEDPNYWGSMFPMGLKRIRDDHERLGLPIERRREILWQGEPDATLLPREYALITEHRTNIPAYGYNRMPMREGVNIPRRFNWDPPGRGVIQKTTDCVYGMYTIHIHGEPEWWSTFTDLDGVTRELYRGRSKAKAWHAWTAHRDAVNPLHGNS